MHTILYFLHENTMCFCYPKAKECNALGLSLVALFRTTPTLESHLEWLTQILHPEFASCQKDAVVGTEDLLS